MRLVVEVVNQVVQMDIQARMVLDMVQMVLLQLLVMRELELVVVVASFSFDMKYK